MAQATQVEESDSRMGLVKDCLKQSALCFCKATESLSLKKEVSVWSPEARVIALPMSEMKLEPAEFNGPSVSKVQGKTHTNEISPNI